jgi:hypothetical protein
MSEEKRPREFLEALQAIPTRARAVKKLYAVAEYDEGVRTVLTFVAPKKLMVRTTERGKEISRFDTDGKTYTERRPKERPRREKLTSIPVSLPLLARTLLGQSLDGWGVSAEDPGRGDFSVRNTTWEGHRVLELSYRGSDSIGRSQQGFLYLDEKTGLPVGWHEWQEGNSPRDDGTYSFFEKWKLFQVTS